MFNIFKDLYSNILTNCDEIFGDFTWRVSDCEELVGEVTGDDGVGFDLFY